MLGLGSGQHRHEGLAESAFGKQAPEQVGNAKGHIEGVGQALAPNIEAMSRRSRTSPVTREARVSRETVEAALNRLTGQRV
jgi:hypothetical protein